MEERRKVKRRRYKAHTYFPGNRLAKYIYPGPAGVVMMSSPSIDLPRAHHESEPKQKRGQSPALV